MSAAVGRLASLAELEALRPEWQRLWTRSPGATPFEAPAWILPWARCFAPDRTRAIALRIHGELIGLVPFFTWQGALLLAGTGPADYGNGLFAPERHRLATLALAELCQAARQLGCERVDLQQLPQDSPLLAAAAPAGFVDTCEPGVPCPVSRLAGPDGLGGLSGSRRGRYLQARRRLERAGSCRFELATAHELDALMGALQELHAARWQQRGTHGVLDAPLMQRFVAAAAAELLAAGLLRLHGLRLDGRVVGALLGLQGRGTFHYYLSGFAPEVASLSPGTLLIGEAMSRAAAEGAERFDFLRGREPYKYHWGAEDRATFRRILRPRV